MMGRQCFSSLTLLQLEIQREDYVADSESATTLQVKVIRRWSAELHVRRL